MSGLHPAPAPNTEDVILVHGTFAANEDDAHTTGGTDRWWQSDSQFAKELSQGLNSGGGPAGKKYSYRVAPLLPYQEDLRPWWAKPFVSKSSRILGLFHWSGANTESARRQAGIRLLDYLQGIEDPPTPGDEPAGYHLVAHSHGGIVVWEMLCEAERRNLGLKRLKSWTTVGTPFLRFEPDWLRGLIFPLIGMLLLALLVWRQLPWWNDFWRQMADSPASPLLICATYLLVYASLATILPLIARALWSCYCFSLSDRKACPDRFALDGWDLASALLALGGALVLIGIVSGLIRSSNDDLFWEVARSDSWRRWPPFLGVAWLVAALVLALVCLARFVTVMAMWVQKSSETEIRDAVWQKWGDKYLAAAQSVAYRDEAINILRALRRPIRGPLLPRFASPRANRYTPRFNRPVNPEQEQLRQKFFPWFLQFALLPIALIWHWIVQPVYNELVAGLIDDFVLDRIRRNAIGEDIAGLKLKEVSIHPRYDIPPIKSDDDLLVKVIDAQVAPQASKFLSDIRTLIGQPWTGGIVFQHFFERALGGKPGPPPYSTAGDAVVASAADILVHTNYFALDQVRAEIVKNIQTPGFAPPAQPPNPDAVITLERAADEVRRKQPSLSDAFWWTMRAVALLLIALSPLEVLAVWGGQLAKPYSREAIANWAFAVASQPQILKFTLDGIKTDGNATSIERNSILPRTVVVANATPFHSRLPAAIPLQYLSNNCVIAHYYVALGRVFETSGNADDARVAYASAARYGANEEQCKVPPSSQIGVSAPSTPSVASIEQMLHSFSAVDSKSLSELDGVMSRAEPVAIENSDRIKAAIQDAKTHVELAAKSKAYAATALLSVLYFRLTEEIHPANQWLAEAQEQLERSGADTDEADYARGYIAAAYADLGRTRDMTALYGLLVKPRCRLLVARHALGWCASPRSDVEAAYVQEARRFMDLHE